MDIYVVQAGDTVNGIAAFYGLESSQIIYDNQLIYPYTLAVGQALFIRGDERMPDKSIYVSGYAYPLLIHGCWSKLCRTCPICLFFHMVLPVTDS